MAVFKFNLMKRVSRNSWRAFVRPAKRLEVGGSYSFRMEVTCFRGVLDATVTAKGTAGEVELAFDLSGTALGDAIAVIGWGGMPLCQPVSALGVRAERTRPRYT